MGTASGDDPPDPTTPAPTPVDAADPKEPAVALEEPTVDPVPVTPALVADDPVAHRPAAAALAADEPAPHTPLQVAHAEHGHAAPGASMFDPLPGEPAAARLVRIVDELVGMTERVVLFAAFAILVLTGLYRTFVDWVFNERPLWAIELVRVSAFSIGLAGAAYATQNRRNFGLDLVSALFPIKIKAVVRVFTNVATLVAAVLLFHGGRLIQHALTKEKQHYEMIPISAVGWLIPICAVLIGFHVLCHIVIEVDYLRSGKTAPEPEVVG